MVASCFALVTPTEPGSNFSPRAATTHELPTTSKINPIKRNKIETDRLGLKECGRWSESPSKNMAANEVATR